MKWLVTEALFVFGLWSVTVATINAMHDRWIAWLIWCLVASAALGTFRHRARL